MPPRAMVWRPPPIGAVPKAPPGPPVLGAGGPAAAVAPPVHPPPQGVGAALPHGPGVAVAGPRGPPAPPVPPRAGGWGTQQWRPVPCRGAAAGQSWGPRQGRAPGEAGRIRLHLLNAPGLGRGETPQQIAPAWCVGREVRDAQHCLQRNPARANGANLLRGSGERHAQGPPGTARSRAPFRGHGQLRTREQRRHRHPEGAPWFRTTPRRRSCLSSDRHTQ